MTAFHKLPVALRHRIVPGDMERRMWTTGRWTGRPGVEVGPAIRVGPDNLEARLEALLSLASDWSWCIQISDTVFP